MPSENIYFISNYENYFNVLNQIRELEPDFKESHVFVEPKSLNTAPAITYAVKLLTEKMGVSEDDPILLVPADHFIGNEEAYKTCVTHAAETVGDAIGTIGIVPTKPHTGYGYIKKGEEKNGYYTCGEFKEKPDQDTAEKYLASGEYLWNSGMYVFNAKTFFKELHTHAPEIATLADEQFDVFEEKFETLPAISVDYALAEKSDNVIVFEGDFDWNDIGSFDSLAETVGEAHVAKARHIDINSHNIIKFKR